MSRQTQFRSLLRTHVLLCRKQRPAATLVAIPAIALSTLFNGVMAGQATEIYSGSGVVISTKGEVLTNAHVVEGCQSITVKLASGITEAAALVASDEKNDLALVRLRATASLSPSVAMLREGSPLRAGDTIVALGYPLSGLLATGANLSVGNVSASAGLRDDSRYLQISAPVQPGNSGGPLLDASGHLVGIVTAKLDAMRLARFTGDIPQNVNFALKAEVARTFLDNKGIAYQTARSDRQLSPADVGDIARLFTVHIECEQVATAPTASSAPLTTPGAGPVEGPKGTEPTRQQIDWCLRSNNPSPDFIIKGCTAWIQSGRNSVSNRALAFVSRGTAYYQKGAFNRAISDFTEAIRLDPKNAIAFGIRGRAYSKKRDVDEAIADYTEAIRLNPKDDSAFYFRGEAYRQKADYDRAIADYTEAIRLNPKDVFASYYARGGAYVDRGDYGHAISDFIIVAKSGLTPSEMAASAATTIGQMYSGDSLTRDYGQAMYWFRIAADKGDAIAMKEISLLYAGGFGVPRDCDLAERWLEKAAKAGNEGPGERHQRIIGRCRMLSQ